MRSALVLVPAFVTYVSLQLFLFSVLTRHFVPRIRSLRLRRMAAGIARGLFLVSLAAPLLSHPRLITGRIPIFWGEMLLYPVGAWAVGSSTCAMILLFFWLIRRVQRRAQAPREDRSISRRDFMERGAFYLGTSSFLLPVYGTSHGRTDLRVEKIHIPMKTLPESLEGFTIVQLTDIHAGPFMTAEEIQRVRETANRLDADLIVLTGDLIAGVKRDIPLLVEGLRGLQARYGVYACLGNHEAFGRLENAVTRELLGAGIRVLRNERTAIEIGNARIELFGIDDLKSGRHGLAQSLTGSSGGDLRVLLSHRPEILTRASQEKIHLVLSGHYHGGQIRFGIGRSNLSVAKFMTPYDEGLYRMGETVLFVGRGIGTTGLPIRINCSPQIAVLKISSRPARTDSGLERT